MRLFISEFITGGGLLHDPLPDGLKQEGLLMLQALVRDCKKIPDLELTLTLDARLSLPMDDVRVIALECKHDYCAVVRQLASQHDHTWLIAPESDDTLAHLVGMLAQDNTSILNCDSSSITCCTLIQFISRIWTQSLAGNIKLHHGAHCAQLIRP